jgi:mRNA-degrading endonuclease toxin of MazEF toxin-antitoxin module
MTDQLPRQGDLWQVNLSNKPSDSVQSDETLTFLVVSADGFNNIATGTVIAVPVYSSGFQPAHQRLKGAGIQCDGECIAHCDKVRAIKRTRLLSNSGMVDSESRERVKKTLASLLDIRETRTFRPGWGK